MSNIIPNIQTKTTKQLDLFSSNLPKKPYCSNDLSYGLKVRGVQWAIKSPYIQPNNPVRKLWLLYDIDRPICPDEITDDLNLPAPTLFVQNKKNNHAHLLYALETPVYMAGNASARAIRFAGAVDVAISQKLDADAGYVGLIAKNPLNDTWRTYSIGNTYDLAELAEYIELSKFSDRRKNLPEIGLGRNCTLFDQTRKWAYKAIREYRGQSSSLWHEEVFTQALCYNTGFTAPLPLSEVKASSKSIANFCLRNDTKAEVKFKEKQSYKGKLGGEASGQVRLKLNESKRTQAIEMSLNNTKVADIAKVLGVHRDTIYRWLK